jgi:SAM-dependent methyltransferase
MRLDVGCGNSPTGNVNVDLYPAASPHHGGPLNTKAIPNFIQCDALHLPFRENTFDEVYASHVLEHFKNPAMLLKEMLRVSKDLVTIIVPHRVCRKTWFRYSQDPEIHQQFFDGATMMKWLSSFGLSYRVSVIQHPFPNSILPIINLPWQVQAEVRKP